MNEQTKEKITFEWIALEKERKLKEINEAKNNIHLRAGELLGSNQSKVKGIEGIMDKISLALVVYDGFRMGMGILKRFRSTFKKRW